MREKERERRGGGDREGRRKSRCVSNSLMNLILNSQYSLAKTDLYRRQIHLKMRWPEGEILDLRSWTLQFHLTISTPVTIKLVKISGQTQNTVPEGSWYHPYTLLLWRMTNKASIMSTPNLALTSGQPVHFQCTSVDCVVYLIWPSFNPTGIFLILLLLEARVEFISTIASVTYVRIVIISK